MDKKGKKEEEREQIMVFIRKILIFIMILAGLLTHLNAQLVVSWTQRYDSGYNDISYGICLDNSGNVYVCGSAGNGSDSDGIVIKYNSSGNQVWVRIYDRGDDEYFSDMDYDRSGYVYCAGNDSNTNYLIVKYDLNGNSIWTQRFSTGNSSMSANGIGVDNSGFVYVTGHEGFNNSPPPGDILTIKYNSSGTAVWTQRYNLGNADMGHGVMIDQNNDLYIAGDVYDRSSRNYGLIKYNTNGVSIWTQIINSPRDDLCRAIDIDNSGNIYLTGQSNYNGDGKIYTLKYSSSGNLMWSRLFDVASDDCGYDISVDDYGYVYLTGYSYNGKANTDYIMIKYSTNGTAMWTNFYDGGHGQDQGLGIRVDSNGFIYVTGYSYNFAGNHDIYTIKYYQPPYPDRPAQLNAVSSDNGVKSWVKSWGRRKTIATI